LLANIQAATDAIFGANNTKVYASGVNQFDVAFIGNLASTNVATLSVVNNLNGNGPAGLNGVADGNVNELQRLTFSGAITGGTFTLTYGSLLSAPVTWDVNPTTLVTNIQTALDTMVGAGNTKVFANP